MGAKVCGETINDESINDETMTMVKINFCRKRLSPKCLTGKWPCKYPSSICIPFPLIGIAPTELSFLQKR